LNNNKKTRLNLAEAEYIRDCGDFSLAEGRKVSSLSNVAKWARSRAGAMFQNFTSLVTDARRHLSNINCLMAHTACLVCFISTVNGYSKKEAFENGC